MISPDSENLVVPQLDSYPTPIFFYSFSSALPILVFRFRCKFFKCYILSKDNLLKVTGAQVDGFLFLLRSLFGYCCTLFNWAKLINFCFLCSLKEMVDVKSIQVCEILVCLRPYCYSVTSVCFHLRLLVVSGSSSSAESKSARLRKVKSNNFLHKMSFKKCH